jgi:hypothetical protein
MSIEIRMQSTPNPNARKFILPEQWFSHPQNFASVEAAAAHPLAMRLFALGGIYNVFLVQDFVTVNKLPNVAWEALEEQIKLTMIDYVHES